MILFLLLLCTFNPTNCYPYQC